MGPSKFELDERYEVRQINRAKRYIEETSGFNDDLTSSAEHTVITTKRVLDRPSNNAPPKVKRKRLRATETVFFRNLLRKSLLMEGQTHCHKVWKKLTCGYKFRIQIKKSKQQK